MTIVKFVSLLVGIGVAVTGLRIQDPVLIVIGAVLGALSLWALAQ